MNYILVFLGGGLGSVSRYGISNLTSDYYTNNFPLATLISNILACLIMGMTFLIFKEKSSVTEWQLFLITGFCGGFSTFSTFSFETVQLIQTNHYFWAGLNVLISITSCIFILYLLLKFR